ncbi:MAG: hypothetical protein HY332_21530 [Chloroflexi bacterium]|nr:hypothetical protein [Chloroflexota bacterium]
MQGFLTLLAGVSTVLDPRYSTGEWAEAAHQREGVDQADAAGSRDEPGA